MLGFKLDVPRREGSLDEKARPVYLDLQVRCNGVQFQSVFLNVYRPLPRSTPECWTLCSRILPINLVTHTVGLTPTDGRQRKQ